MTLFGILNVNKPIGMTSRDVVNRVERLVRPAKVGHAGTLDPLASGVLVICVGQATRLIQYVQQMAKVYRATFLLGQRSETDDLEGELQPVAGAVEPSREMLDHVLSKFVGDIEQRPPAHSAVKLAGRRAYDLARRGIEFQLKPRTVRIHNLSVRRFAYPELDLEVECGSGTYIRALGRDIGEMLGTGAVMSALERSSVGAFRIDNSANADTLSEESIRAQLHPATAAVSGLPTVVLTEAQVFELRHGRPILVEWITRSRNEVDRSAIADSELAAADAAGQLVAILREKRAGELWPVHNFGARSAS